MEKSNKVENNPFVFKGKLRKIRIISDQGCDKYLRENMETEQRLTINSQGKVWFSAYGFMPLEDGNIKYTKVRKIIDTIDKSSAKKILEKVEQYFSKDYPLIAIKDGGGWNIELTNTDGEVYRGFGSFREELYVGEVSLSYLIKSRLSIPHLFVFDGNIEPYVINKIELDYHRNTAIKTNVSAEGIPLNISYYDYTEKLIIDRFTYTIEHICNVDSGCKITHKYEFADDVGYLLDEFEEVDIFNYIKGNFDDVVENPDESRDYKIVIDYDKGTQRIIKGTFDKNGLPADFDDFVEEILGLIRFYKRGEILNPAIYGKEKRRKSDYIFCSVTFDYGFKSYYYLTEDDDINVGDFVVVPVGKENRESIAKVEKIEYFSIDNVPLPLEKTKYIIRKSVRGMI